MKISYCTSSKDRELHLFQTLPFNLKQEHIDGLELEYIVVDYSSKQNIAKEVVERFKELSTPTSVLKVFRVEGIDQFHFPHAKNVSHKLATGDIVCNLDADNYVLPVYSKYLQFVFNNYDRAVVHGWLWKDGTYGRVAMQKDQFYKLGGYDERMPIGWGNDDQHLIERAERDGCVRIVTPDAFVEAIQHGDEFRNVGLNISKSITSQQNADYKEESYKKQGLVANQGLTWGNANSIIQYL